MDELQDAEWVDTKADLKAEVNRSYMRKYRDIRVKKLNISDLYRMTKECYSKISANIAIYVSVL